MEEWLRMLAGYVALAVEIGATVIVLIGAVEAFARLVAIRLAHPIGMRDQKDVWMRFAAWLVLGLEFELAADIVRSAISPSWDQIGQLGAIAVIRTFLNYFLTRDIESYEADTAGERPRAPAGAD